MSHFTQAGWFNGSIDPSSLSYVVCELPPGRCCKTEIQDHLLGIPERGTNLHKSFVEECQKDPSRFEKPIRRVKFLSFGSECVTSKSANSSLAKLQCTSTLFGRILTSALAADILPLELILKHPLTPVPLSMAAGDGTMTKTDKSVLSKIIVLGNAIDSLPQAIDTTIIDGGWLLNTFLAYPTITARLYGDLARWLLIKILSLSSAPAIHVAFDAYYDSSLKAVERDRRGTTATPYVITGPNQQRPRDFSKALRSTSFKKNLPSFLISEWNKNDYATLFEDKILFVNHLNKCVRYSRNGSTVLGEKIKELEAENHEEADTRICLQVTYAAKLGHPNILVHSSDTDVLIILLYHAALEKFSSSNVFLKTSRHSSIIPISQLARTMGSPLCLALPGFHAFTGSDYTSSFYKKGKAKPYNLLLKDKSFQKVFAHMSSSSSLSKNNQMLIEHFTCKMYQGGKIKNLDELRSIEFRRKFTHAKNVNAAVLPPCTAELKPHIARASFIARMWANADKTNLPEVGKGDGWTIGPDGQIQIEWFVGEQFPPPDLAVREQEELDEDINSIEEECDSDCSLDDDEDDY